MVNPKFGTTGRSLLVRWLLIASAARLPVAMAPLLLVFALHQRDGNYAIGTLIVGLFVVGELGGALASGVLSGAGRARRRLSIGLAISAVAFAGLIAFELLPLVAIGFLAFVAGVASASAPGALQAMLLEPFQESEVPRVLSIARVQSTVVFLVAPALVGAISITVGAEFALIVCAAAMGIAAGAVPLLPAVTVRAPSRETRTEGLRAVLRAWPIYAGGIAATFVVGIADLLIAPLLASRDVSLALAGPLLTAFFIVSLLGSILYGSRKRWPGTFRRQSLALTCVMVVGLAVAAFVPNAVGISIGLLVAAAGVAILLMIRTLALREVLAKHLHAAAFSFNYATSCISYVLCAVIGGSLLAVSNPQIALLVAAGSVLILAIVAYPFEACMRRLAAD